MYYLIIYQRDIRNTLFTLLHNVKRVYPSTIRKSKSLSPLGKYCLLWGNCSNAVHMIDFQSNVNIMQVHSSATAALFHRCQVVALTLE